MSFGWSAGDIVTTVSLVNRVLSSVRSVGGAREHFQELESELLGLENALTTIQKLVKTYPGEPGVQVLASVSSNCKNTLERFQEKVRPYEGTLGCRTQKSKIRSAPKGVVWELMIRKDIPELRTYLVGHVGYINLMLATSSLELTGSVRTDLEALKQKQEHAYQSLSQQSQRSERSLSILLNEEAVTTRTQLNRIAQVEIMPKLEQLLSVNTEVKESNEARCQLLIESITKLDSPDRRFTWAQDPVKVEDALGRIWPVPSEHSSEMLDAAIRAKFSSGPGSDKVHSGEYEILETSGPTSMILGKDLEHLFPGMQVRMTVIIGQFANSDRCPRYGCSGDRYVREHSSTGKTWRCTSCFGTFCESRKILPRPYKAVELREDDTITDSKCLGHVDARHTMTWRRLYRNISIHLDELPRTPDHFREEYNMTYQDYCDTYDLDRYRRKVHSTVQFAQPRVRASFRTAASAVFAPRPSHKHWCRPRHNQRSVNPL